MDEHVDIVELAKKANKKIKDAIAGGNASGAISAIYGLVQEAAVKDDNTARQFVAKISKNQEMFDVKEWYVGMTTKPGDMVHYSNYNFIYSGTEPMTHANQVAYPGAIGVTYWQVIPETKDDWKVWPDVPDVACAVLMGESWWNVEKTKLYTWNDEDTVKCTLAPSDSVPEWTHKDIVEVG